MGNRSRKLLPLCEIGHGESRAPWSMTFSGVNFRNYRFSPVFSWVSAHSLRRFPASWAIAAPSHPAYNRPTLVSLRVVGLVSRAQ